VREIYDTEKSYVASLDLLVKYYLKPMRQQNIVPKPKVAFIFGNVEHILIINRELLETLEKRIATWNEDSVLGDAMNKLIPWLRLYSEYCSNFHNVTALVLKLSEKSSFAEFLNRQKDTNNILDLPSLLIMPIQRIPRYKMLLEQVVKFTPETHHDYKALMNALERVSEVALLVNESVRKKQNLEQLAELEKRLMGKYPKNMTQAGRVLIHEGELTKLCRKVPKKRYFFLFNDLLLYGVANPLNRTYIIHRTISLLAGRIIPVDDSDKVKNGFKIISKEKSFLVWADTPEEKLSWTAKIEAAKESLKQNPHTTGGEGYEEYEAPIWQNDEESNTCTLCQIHFTTLRRKHHCRKCGRLACGKCTEHRYELPNIGKERVCDDCFADLSGQPSKRKTIRDKMNGQQQTDVLSPRLEMGLVPNRGSGIIDKDAIDTTELQHTPQLHNTTQPARAHSPTPFSR